MTAAYFIDTNVLLYAASNAPADQAKRQLARSLLAQPDIGFSAQVLQEFYSAATAKKHLQMTRRSRRRPEVARSLSSLANFARARIGGNRCEGTLWHFLLGRGRRHGSTGNG